MVTPRLEPEQSNKIAATETQSCFNNSPIYSCFKREKTRSVYYLFLRAKKSPRTLLWLSTGKLCPECSLFLCCTYFFIIFQVFSQLMRLVNAKKRSVILLHLIVLMLQSITRDLELTRLDKPILNLGALHLWKNLSYLRVF